MQALRAPQAATAAKAAGIKYSTQVVFENERVRVKDVTFPAGVLDTGMHTHDLAHVGVILTEGQLLFTEKDGKKETASFTSGSVGFRGPNATHMVANPGTQDDAGDRGRAEVRAARRRRGRAPVAARSPGGPARPRAAIAMP